MSTKAHFWCAIVALWLGCTISASADQWLTYGKGVERHNYNPKEVILSPASVPTLAMAWQTSLSGPVLTQPVLATAVPVDDGTGNLVPTDLVYAADLNGEVMALNAQTGATVWTTSVPAEPFPCKPADQELPSTTVAGVVGTPTIERRNNRMFLVAADGSLYALALDTGVPLAGYPLQVLDAANANGVTIDFGSPTYDGLNGVLYVPTAGSCETPTYQGQLVQVDVGTDTTVIPAVLRRWFPTAASQSPGGGIWGPGGVSIEKDGSVIYTATGNAYGTPENIDYAEHVVALDSQFNVIASDGPALNGSDEDFGATPLEFHPTGCPPMLAVMDKIGKVFIYQRAGTGISNGPFQTVNVTEHDVGFIGMPTYDPQSNQLFFGNNLNSRVHPRFTHGLVAMGVQADCKLSLNWVQAVGNSDITAGVIPATVANGVVYFPGTDGVLYIFDTAGNPLWNSGSSTGPIYTAPTIVNGMLLVADYYGGIAAFSPQQDPTAVSAARTSVHGSR